MSHTDDATFLYELRRDSKTSELVSYLRMSEEPAVRRRVADILGDFSDVPQDHKQEEIVQALIETVKHDDSERVRARAIDALYRHGQETIERLIGELSAFDLHDAPEWATAQALTEWLDADYPEFRLAAAAALGRVGDASALSFLLEAFDDPDARVRARAVRSCGRIGHPGCVQRVIEMLEDPNPVVRRAATDALGTIGTEEALEALIPVARADDESLRRRAVSELGQLEDTRALIVLIRCVEDDSGSVRGTATVSLVRLLSSVPADRRDEARQLVADQLESATTTDVVPHLVDVVAEDAGKPPRRNAVWLLGRLVDPEDDHYGTVLDCLVDVLDDEDDRTARLAAESLGEIGGERLVTRLRVYVHDEVGSPAAVDRARTALEAIDGGTVGELVTNSVEYTYVREPADYTRKKRGQ